MRRAIAIIGLLLVLMPVTPAGQARPGATSGKSSNALWDVIATNNPEGVIDKLANGGELSVGELHLLASAYLAKGNWPSALKTWMRVAAVAPDLGTLVMIRAGCRYADPGPSLAGLYETLLSDLDGRRPLEAQFIREHLQELYLSRGEWKKASELSIPLGQVRSWSYAAGPFGRYGSMDLHEAFDIERRPWAPAFEGWLRTVHPRPAASSLTGEIRFTWLINPPQGAAYARFDFDAESSRPARFLINTGDSVVLWLNGRRVLVKDVDNRDAAGSMQVLVNIDKGRNVLVLKSLKRSPGWNSTLSIRAESGGPLAVVPAAISDSTSDMTFLDPSPQVHGIPLPLVPLEQSASGHEIPPAVYQHIVQPHVLLWNEDYANALQRVDESLEKAPRNAYLHALKGEILLARARAHSGSRVRLENQAAASLENALSIYPRNPHAAALLIQCHLNRGTHDSALALLGSYRTEQPADPDPSPLLLYQAAQVYRAKQFEIEERRSLETLLELQPTFGTGSIQLAKALEASGNLESALKAIETGLARSRNDSALVDEKVRLLEAMSRMHDVAATLQDWLVNHPEDVRRTLDLAELFINSGRWSDALGILEEVLAANPESARARRLKARWHLLLSHKDGDDTAKDHGREAALLIKQLLDESPADPELNRLYDTLQGDPRMGIREGDPFYAPYDVSYEIATASPIHEERYPKADAILLLDLQITALHPDGTSRDMTHQIAKILNKGGREKWAEIDVPSSDADLLWARTILADGKVHEAESINRFGNRNVISMYGLEDGCFVDVAYVQYNRYNRAPGQNAYQGRFFFGQSTDPMLLSRWVLRTPKSLPLQWVSSFPEFAPAIRDEGTDRIYIWENREQEGAENEPRRPDIEELVPTINVSTFRDWTGSARNTILYEKGVYESSPEIDSLAGSIANASGDFSERVRAVYDAVLDSIEDGQGGPTTADTLALHKGSSFDRAALARTLLDRNQIQSHLAYTCDSRQFGKLPALPKPYLFDSALLFVPWPAAASTGTGNDAALYSGLWLDFSSRYASPGESIPSRKEQSALVSYPDGIAFEALNPQRFAGGWIRNNMVINLAIAGPSTVSASLEYLGAYKRAMLERQTDRASLDSLLDSQVARVAPGVTVTRRDLLGRSRYDTPALIFEGGLDRFVAESGDSWSFKPVTDLSRLAEIVKDATRDYDLVADAPLAMSPSRTTYRLPGDGHTWDFPPDDVFIVSEFGTFSLTYRIMDGGLVVRRSVMVPPQRIEPHRYGAFVEFARQVDTAEARDVRFIKRP